MQDFGGDIVVSGATGIVLIGWIWNVPTATRAEAEMVMDQLAQTIKAEGPDFLMLLSQTKGFFWHRSPDGRINFVGEVPVIDVFERYFGPLADGKRVQGSNLQEAALDWLHSLAHAGFPWPDNSVAKETLTRIGLLDALEGTSTLVVTS
jgi:hypothetical protein